MGGSDPCMDWRGAPTAGRGIPGAEWPEPGLNEGASWDQERVRAEGGASEQGHRRPHTVSPSPAPVELRRRDIRYRGGNRSTEKRPDILPRGEQAYSLEENQRKRLCLFLSSPESPSLLLTLPRKPAPPFFHSQAQSGCRLGPPSGQGKHLAS